MRRWIAGLLLVAIAALAGFLVFRPAEPAAAPSPAQASAPADTAITSSTSTDQGFAENLGGLQEISSEQVSYISRRDNRYVLHLLDGRQVEVYPFELDRLPAALRLRLEYQRER
jgi:hypothetical protein